MGSAAFPPPRWSGTARGASTSSGCTTWTRTPRPASRTRSKNCNGPSIQTVYHLTRFDETLNGHNIPAIVVESAPTAFLVMIHPK
ncbi:unnamed protein product [Heterosigma akashiwo]